MIAHIYLAWSKTQKKKKVFPQIIVWNFNRREYISLKSVLSFQADLQSPESHAQDHQHDAISITKALVL